MKIIILLLSVLICSHGKPLDDDSPAPDAAKQPDEDAPKPAEETAGLSDSPITDPLADKPVDTLSEDADKRDITTTTTTPEVTKAITGKTETTPSPTTQESTTEPPVTTPTPDENDKPTVEKSENNTLTMKGTTFHVAIEDQSVQFYEEMNKNMHDIHRHTFQTMIGAVYKDYPDFKQVVIIKFSETGKGKDSDEKTRADVTNPGVVVDFYLRFYNPGTHLKKLTETIQTGQLQTHKVKPLFIRAYVAEPTGRVCTPDCKVQCYSYCDAGCCHINIVQNIELPTPSPVEEFIEQQQNMLKTGVMPEKPKCEGNACAQQQQPCQGPQCAPQMMMLQMPCQGASCAPPMLQMMPQMPCQGASCAPPIMPQMPCQGASCAPPIMQQMPCQGGSCSPPPMMPMMQQMPCQGQACGQMPCQGASCVQSMMPMVPQMPCQGASCAPPPMMPMVPQMGCAPSCSQVCAPACPSQCCGMQPQMMQSPMYAPPARCGPKGC